MYFEENEIDTTEIGMNPRIFITQPNYFQSKIDSLKKEESKLIARLTEIKNELREINEISERYLK